jgi:predicted nuclease with TOPRIM domain
MKMGRMYEKIEFFAGNTIEQAVNQLLNYKAQGKLVCGEFNGITLYSDTVTMDSAYKEITGKTKAEFDKGQQEWKDNYDKQKQEHEEKIPELTKVWMEKGREVLTEDKWEYWDKIVPIRLNDLYQGMELGNCLDIVNILNNNGTLDEAKEVIENQGHSGMSFGLVCAMVREFCDRGSEFVECVR